MNNLTESLNTDTVTTPLRSLKICLLGYRGNPYSGGQGVYIYYLSRALIAAGHQVDVISGPPYPHLDPAVRLIKLPSLDLYAANDHVMALKFKHLLSFTDFYEWFSMLTGGFAEPYTFGRRLTKYFKTQKPDYDILHDNQSLCYGTLALQRQGIPLITTIHHSITNDRDIALKQANSWQQRLLIKRWHTFLGMQKKVTLQLKHIVTVSNVSRQDIASAFNIPAAKVNLVYNGIDTDVFKPLPNIKSIPYRIMVTASADQPLKGLDYLLKAIPNLILQYPDINLIILGKLHDAGPTAKLVQELNISKHLSFVANVETMELVKLYAQAKIVVVPSVYEGFGLPAGEAMACGIPVISTTGGALPEVVGDAGILVPVKDSSAIASSISQLLNDPERAKALGHRGQQRILKLFSWGKAADQMLQLYQQVLRE